MTPGHPSIFRTAQTFSRLVKLGHTVFGLPFALAAAVLAHRFAVAHGGEGLSSSRLALVVLAFTGARAAAMGWNRIIDRRFDAQNPRTADREIPTGVISVRAAACFTIVAAAVFVAAAFALGPVPAALAGPCLVVVLGYSLFKRFSWTSHLFLGGARARAPGFDRAHGLHSIPARFGIRGALVVSALLHVATVAALVALHVVADLGPVHLCGVLLVAAILGYEHSIVRPGDLRRLDRAFFDLNGYVSLGYLAAVVVDVLVP
jgi:4-hydroxybenzoate polyprenyltransferase